MNILVTGGAGYIGSHTVLELLNQNYQVTVVDNLCNSSLEALKRVEKLSGKKITIHVADLRDETALDDIFTTHRFNVVIHFAGLKAVGESVADPLSYYDNNVGGTLALCRVMEKHGVRQFIFSSSATVYGLQNTTAYTEDMPLHPQNPYGRTKTAAEEILQDLCNSKKDWQVSSLRYFNPVGADKSGQIGEDPNGVPNNLFPFVAQVAVGKREELAIFGDDYDTPDGTGIRDYVHVSDLARAHVAALEHMPRQNTFETYNIGSGKGASVLEVVAAFQKASGRKISYQVVDRRPGDLAEYYAVPTKAEQALDWHAKQTLADACADTWLWQQQNPDGYTITKEEK